MSDQWGSIALYFRFSFLVSDKFSDIFSVVCTVPNVRSLTRVTKSYLFGSGDDPDHHHEVDARVESRGVIVPLGRDTT